jgi:uncharacterized protein
MPAYPAIDIETDVPCRMRDDVILRADVYRPRGAGPLPAVVMRLPYGKNVWTAQGVPSPRRVAEAGYVVVVQDVRGRFASEGTFVPNLQELDDGYDTLAWAARLPGSNGVVGTFGPSYLAHVQWAAALSGPGALASMITMVSPNHTALDGYVVRGGVVELGSRLGWAYGSIAASAPGAPEDGSLERRFADGSIYRERPFRQLAAREPALRFALEIWRRPAAQLADEPTSRRADDDRRPLRQDRAAGLRHRR